MVLLHCWYLISENYDIHHLHSSVNWNVEKRYIMQPMLWYATFPCHKTWHCHLVWRKCCLRTASLCVRPWKTESEKCKSWKIENIKTNISVSSAIIPYRHSSRTDCHPYTISYGDRLTRSLLRGPNGPIRPHCGFLLFKNRKTIFFWLNFVKFVENFYRGTIVVRVTCGRRDPGRTKNGDKRCKISIRVNFRVIPSPYYRVILLILMHIYIWVRS